MHIKIEVSEGTMRAALEHPTRKQLYAFHRELDDAVWRYFPSADVEIETGGAADAISVDGQPGHEEVSWLKMIRSAVVWSSSWH